MEQTFIIITVDTETGQFHGRNLPVAKRIYGKIEDEDYGIVRIMDMCDKYGFKATFFVDVYEYHEYGEEEIKKVCLNIHDRNHDVQLHTHPTWLKSDDRWLMSKYSLNEQIEIMQEGKNLIYKWLGEYPVAHRAGAYGANFDTLSALRENQISIDSSLLLNYPFCEITSPPLKKNSISIIEGVIEIPMTVFMPLKYLPVQRYKYRPLDINTSTFNELKYVIRQAKKNGLKTIVLSLHSFSFINSNKDRTEFYPDIFALNKFEQLLDSLAKDSEIQVITMKDFHRLYLENPAIFKDNKEYIPHTGILLTTERTWRDFGKGWQNNVFLFFMLMVICGIIFVIGVSILCLLR
ncbi:MAG: hypothetical protein ABIF11_09760 [Nitrospirota bacterium]